MGVSNLEDFVEVFGSNHLFKLHIGIPFKSSMVFFFFFFFFVGGLGEERDLKKKTNCFVEWDRSLEGDHKVMGNSLLSGCFLFKE